MTTIHKNMESIHDPDETFLFDKIKLTSPQSLGSGNFMIKYLLNHSPIYIKPPKCSTKQGIVKVGKKLYCDLVFSRDNESFIQWFENLEANTQKWIYDNRNKWFDVPLEMHDIEGFFTSSLKSFKSGKFYSIRVNIPASLGKCSLKIYNEKGHAIDAESINENTDIMTIMEIQCIKCSSRSFQIELELKQIMVLEPVRLFDTCLFIQPNKNIIPSNDGTHISDVKQTNSVINIDERNQSSVNKENTENIENSNKMQCNNAISINNTTDECIKIEIDDPAELFANTQSTTLQNNTNSQYETEKNVLPININTNTHTSNDLEIDTTLSTNDSMISKSNIQPNSEYQTNNDYENTMDNYSPEKDMNTELAFEIPTQDLNPLNEINIDLDELKIEDDNPIQLKQRNDVYYEMYREARRKAKIAKDLALSAYLEAKRIKNTYLLDNIDDTDDSDFENDELND